MKKRTSVYHHTVETLDRDTGEVHTETKTSVSRYSGEPPFVKLYIDDICHLVEAPESLKNVLLLMLRKLDYDGYMTLSSRYRKMMCEELGIVDQTLRNRLNGLVKKGFVISEGGNEYLANPMFFARGEWRKIVEQRSAFELRIKYTESGREIITEKV